MSRRLLSAVVLVFVVAGLGGARTQAQQQKFIPNTIRADVFLDINRPNNVNEVRNDPRYPDNPTEVHFLKYFEFPAGADDGAPPPGNVIDNYGARIWGFLTPKETASYVFFIASDDPGELWLSTDDKEANKRLLANEPEWNGVRAWTGAARRPGCPDNGGTKCNNRSDPVRLEANKRYFIEAIFKEGLGGDNLAVTWIKQGDPDPENGALPLSADLLGAMADTTLKISQQPQPSLRDAGQTANFTVSHNSLGPGTPVTYQWRKNGTAIAGATSKQYTTGPLTVADNNAKISVVVSAGGQNVTSQDATLTVLAVGAPIFIPGLLVHEAYFDIPGTPVQNLLDDPKFPSSPDDVVFLTSFNTRTGYPDDSHSNFGARISGLFTAPETAQYEFFIRSDDASHLYLSTDDKTANLALIAEETGCCGQFEETGAPETSIPVALQAGKQYAIQVLYKEGGGGDWAMVAFRKVGDKTPSSQLQPIPGSFLGSMIPAKGQVTITKPPTNVTAAQNDRVKFSVDATSTHGPMAITWTRNGIPLAASGKEIELGPLTAADSGAKIKATVSVPGATASSSEVTLTVTDDKTPPAVLKVTGSETFTTLTVQFSEGVTEATANVASNYGVPGLTISAAKRTKSDTVVLTTSRQEENKRYTLTVSNVRDTASTPNTIAAPGNTRAFTSFVFTPGVMRFSAWENLPGNTVASLVDAPVYQDSGTTVRVVPGYEAPTNFGDLFGGRVNGWITPARTGKYQFFLAADDNAELWLSTDDTPANKALIASEPQWSGVRSWVTEDRRPGCPDACENRSAFISLQAGKRYYTELLYKEGLGGDNAAATWRLEGDPLPANGAATLLTGNLVGTFAEPADTPTEAPRFSTFNRDGTNLKLEWSGGGTLEAADEATGPWAAVANANSPATVPISGARRFYRIRR